MLERFDRETPAEKIFDALDREGGVIVEGAVSTDVVEALVGDFAPHLEATDWNNTDAGPDAFFGLRTKRLHGLLARSPRFAEIVSHPLLLAMCKHFLAARCRDYRVSTGELMALGEGQDDQLLHRDADSWFHLPRPRPEILISANIALTDFSEENGATRIVPGSHRWPDDREAEPAEIVQAVMPRGSAVLYTGNVLHGGGANRTGSLRVGLYVGYIVSWLRPIENHLITNGEAAVRAAPPAVRQLLDCTDSGWTPFA